MEYATIQPSGALFTALSKNAGKQPREYANIANEGLKKYEDYLFLSSLAEEIGVNFEATGYTYCARRGSGARQFVVYGPAVYAGLNGEPTLVWGNTLTPIEDLSVPATLTVIDNKYTFLVLDTETAGSIKVPLKLLYQGEGKDRKPAWDVLKLSTGFNSGDVAGGMERVKVMSQSMGKLPENTEWTVTAHAVNAFGKSALLIESTSDELSAFDGWYTADDNTPAQLAGRTHLIGEEPVTLFIGEHRGQTKHGNPKASADLEFESDTEVEEFAYCG
jgi:hypothetical protein